MQRGYTLNDVGGVLSWDALDDFLSNIEPGSALAFDIDPERAQWATADKTNSILADIYDLLAVTNYYLAALASQKRPKKPEPYKRPGQKPEKKHIGTASIPIADVKNFIFKKLRGE